MCLLKVNLLCHEAYLFFINCHLFAFLRQINFIGNALTLNRGPEVNSQMSQIY